MREESDKNKMREIALFQKHVSQIVLHFILERNIKCLFNLISSLKMQFKNMLCVLFIIENFNTLK